MPELKPKLSLGISSKRIAVLFLFLVFLVFLPTLFFVQMWITALNEKSEARLLEQAHYSLTVFFDSQKSLYGILAESYSSDPRVSGLFSRQGREGLDFSSDGPIKGSGIDFILILDLEGEILAGNADLRGVLGENTFSANEWARHKGSSLAASGFWHDFKDRLWFMASSPLFPGVGVDKAGEADKRMGTIVVGSLVDDSFLEGLGSKLSVTLEAFHAALFFKNSGSQVTDSKDFLIFSWNKLLSLKEPFVIHKHRKGEYTGLLYLDFLIKDLNGAAVGIFRINDRAGILWQEKLIFSLIWVTVLALAVFSILTIKFFAQHVTIPLVKIKDAMQEIKSSGDLSKRLEVSSNDEVGGVISEFNNMLEELEKMNKKIRRSSSELSILYNDLLDQKKFTSEIISTAPGIVLVLLPDGRVKFVNEAIERITGYKREETIGKQWFEHFLSFNKRREIETAIEDMARGNLEPYRQIEYPILTNDAQERHILWNHSVLQDKEGRVTAIIAIGQDITEIKKIETELVKKINDLERFHKVTMDREKVIIQLKEEIRGLKAKFEGIKGTA